jgi:hypothetical protein
MSAVDLAHATLAWQGNNLVVTDLVAGRQRHKSMNKSTAAGRKKGKLLGDGAYGN